MVIITTKPTMTLIKAIACAAFLAPMAVRAPIRFPMRFEATTPGEMSDGTDRSSHWGLTKSKRQRAYDYGCG